MVKKNGDGGEILRCSFCNKGQEEVRRLIAGPNQVYICDECVQLCREIIEEEEPTAPRVEPSFAGIPTPRELYDRLNSYVIGQDRERRQAQAALNLLLGDGGGHVGPVHHQPHLVRRVLLVACHL